MKAPKVRHHHISNKTANLLLLHRIQNLIFQENVHELQNQIGSLLQEKRTEFVKGRWKQVFRDVKLEIKNEKLKQAFSQIQKIEKQKEELQVLFTALQHVNSKIQQAVSSGPLGSSTPLRGSSFNRQSLFNTPSSSVRSHVPGSPETPGFNNMNVSALNNQTNTSLSLDDSNSFDLRHGVGLDPSTRQYPVSNDQSSFEPLNNLNSSSFDVSGISTNSTFNITDDLGGCGLEK